MKKIKKFLILPIMMFTLLLMSNTKVSAGRVIPIIQPDEPITIGISQNKLRNVFEFDDSLSSAVFLGSKKSDSLLVKSNRNATMGYLTSYYEFYCLYSPQYNFNTIICLFENTSEPLDDVAYANGMGGWFTEHGQSYTKYIETKSTVEKSYSELIDVLPDSTMLQYSTSISVGCGYTVDHEGHIEPSISVSVTEK